MSAVDDPAVRVEAVEALLVEKGLVDPSVIDEVIEHYAGDDDRHDAVGSVRSTQLTRQYPE
jgi:hypothetical protein